MKLKNVELECPVFVLNWWGFQNQQNHAGVGAYFEFRPGSVRRTYIVKKGFSKKDFVGVTIICNFTSCLPL